MVIWTLLSQIPYYMFEIPPVSVNVLFVQEIGDVFPRQGFHFRLVCREDLWVSRLRARAETPYLQSHHRVLLKDPFGGLKYQG
jgi:hypothetical protein